MPHHAVRSALRGNARRMRKDMTEAELKLWNAVRAHRLMGLGFRRQMPIAGYIVDFACPVYRIALEVDGSGHAEAQTSAADARRSQALASLGWTILRFWNDDVLGDIDGVCTHVLRTIGFDAFEERPSSMAQE